MRIDEINPIPPVSQSQATYAQSNPAPTPPAEKPLAREADATTISGQLSLNGVTAYFQVQDGIKVVYSLIENSTGRVIRHASPEEMLRLSGAIDEMLDHRRDVSSTEKGE